ncbi:glycosyltransferase family 4 protein [Symmachiella dynata]|uniref:glycosyltransferase family 4 protein n=1 Tax=Symmachiella dynata TaxID=2527995 RepID=UPI0030EC4A4B
MATQTSKHNGTVNRESQLGKLRCALFTPNWPANETSNGIVTYVSVLEQQLRRDGHSPLVVTRAKSTAVRYADDAGVTQWSPCESVISRISDRLTRIISKDDAERNCRRAGRGIAHALTQTGGDGAVNLLEMEESFGLARHVAQRVPFPVVVRLHGPWFLNGQANGVKQDKAFARRVKAEGKAIEAACAVTACSQKVLDTTREYYNLELPQAAVIPNPAPVYSSDMCWNADEAEERTILFVGRFDRHKGGDTMLLAFQRIVEQFPDAHLVFIGPDTGIRSQDDQVVKFAEFVAEHLDESVAQRINYLGKQAPSTIETWRRRAAVTVIPSTFDNFPYSALESVACGCPIVATRVGGIPEIILDDKTGVLVQPDNPESLAAGVGRILADRGLAAQLGAAAAEDSNQRFHPRKIAEQTAEFYQSVIAQWKAGT